MLGRVFAILRKKVAQGSDARLKIVQDIIMGIKMIKIYAWEKFFWDNIEIARK